MRHSNGGLGGFRLGRTISEHRVRSMNISLYLPFNDRYVCTRQVSHLVFIGLLIVINFQYLVLARDKLLFSALHLLLDPIQHVVHPVFNQVSRNILPVPFFVAPEFIKVGSKLLQYLAIPLHPQARFSFSRET